VWKNNFILEVNNRIGGNKTMLCFWGTDKESKFLEHKSDYSMILDCSLHYAYQQTFDKLITDSLRIRVSLIKAFFSGFSSLKLVMAIEV